MVGLWCYNQSGVAELLIMRDPHYLILIRCVLSQLKPSELYILSFFTANNVELPGFYPILMLGGSEANVDCSALTITIIVFMTPRNYILLIRLSLKRNKELTRLTRY